MKRPAAAGPEMETGALEALAQSRPGVSVLMPVHNAEATLSEAVRSVIGQTSSDWELVIADDGSEDGSVRAAQAIAASDDRISVLSAERKTGAAAARNRALAAARGRYIAFLDADDLWLPEKLERQIGFMRTTGAALSFTAFTRRRPGARDRVQPVPATIDYDTLLRGNVIGCLTAIYDTARTGKRPMAEIPRRHDFALWLEIVKEAGLAHGLNEPLAIHRMSRGSLSANRIAAMRDTWRMYRQVIGLSRLTAAECLISHLIKRAIR